MDDDNIDQQDDANNEFDIEEVEMSDITGPEVIFIFGMLLILKHYRKRCLK